MMAEYAVMPYRHYKDACDAVRAKGSGSSSIKSGELASAISSISAGGGAPSANEITRESVLVNHSNFSDEIIFCPITNGAATKPLPDQFKGFGKSYVYGIVSAQNWKTGWNSRSLTNFQTAIGGWAGTMLKPFGNGSDACVLLAQPGSYALNEGESFGSISGLLIRIPTFYSVAQGFRGSLLKNRTVSYDIYQIGKTGQAIVIVACSTASGLIEKTDTTPYDIDSFTWTGSVPDREGSNLPLQVKIFSFSRSDYATGVGNIHFNLPESANGACFMSFNVPF